MNTNDNLMFASENEYFSSSHDDVWKILLVDDEPSVHDVTLLALNKFIFKNKKALFLHAYSAAEAQQVLQQHDDIAVALIDVVMETDDAGLRLVKWIREDLNNAFMRLILRTGQPGQAPEKDVILDHDINDYKEKTELTFNKLYTLMVTSIRSYESLLALERSRNGLMKIVTSSKGLSTHGSIETFVEGVLMQLQSVFDIDETAFYCVPIDADVKTSNPNSDFLVVSGDKVFSGTRKMKLQDIQGSALERGINRVVQAQKTLFIGSGCYIYFRSDNGNHCVIFFDRLNQPLDETEKGLLDVFCNNINYAFDNLTLNKEVDNNQREIVFTLGTIAEFRSRETGRHIVRVSKFAERLGQLYGLSMDESELLLKAMPMHDIGKIAIPDSILHKPGELSVAEKEVMKEHAQHGYEMLKGSKRKLFLAAAIIAQQHHERWDGKGYPKGLHGDDIHLYGRIAAVADVFDALCHKRIYKDAWPIEHVITYFQQERAGHFDPAITDLLLDNMDQFVALSREYGDAMGLLS